MNGSLTAASIAAYRGVHDQESQLRRRGLGRQVRLRVAPDEESPFAHKLGGSGQINVDDVAPWDAIRVAGDVVRVWVAGPEGLELIAFGTSTGGMDAELVQPDAG